MIADGAAKVKGGTMKPELEALHKQLDALTTAVSGKALEALLQLCEDWQKHAFAVGFTTAVRLLTK